MTDTPTPTDAQQAIHEATQAMRRGERAQARRWHRTGCPPEPRAGRSLADPGSCGFAQRLAAYLRRALEINPNSKPARRGMAWAVQRLRQSRPPAQPSSPQHRRQAKRQAPARRPFTRCPRCCLISPRQRQVRLACAWVRLLPPNRWWYARQRHAARAANGQCGGQWPSLCWYLVGYAWRAFQRPGL